MDCRRHDAARRLRSDVANDGRHPPRLVTAPIPESARNAIGNAVPVDLGRVIGESILEHVKQSFGVRGNMGGQSHGDVSPDEAPSPSRAVTEASRNSTSVRVDTRHNEYMDTTTMTAATAIAEAVVRCV